MKLTHQQTSQLQDLPFQLPQTVTLFQQPSLHLPYPKEGSIDSVTSTEEGTEWLCGLHVSVVDSGVQT